MQFNGLPYRGPPLPLKEDDPEYRQPRLTYKAHAKVFDLSNPEELEEYTKTWTDITAGNCMLGIEDVQYSTALGNYKIFMRWVEQYYTAPPTTGDTIDVQE